MAGITDDGWIARHGWAVSRTAKGVVHVLSLTPGNDDMPLCKQKKKGGKALVIQSRGNNLLESGNQGRYPCRSCMREIPKVVVPSILDKLPLYMRSYFC